VISVRTEGFAELNRALEELGKVATQKASLRRAAIKALQPMADLAQSLAPRRIGHLADSITVSTRAHGATDAGRAAFGAALQSGASRAEATQALRDARRSDAGTVFVHMGPGRHPQAITQEFGTSFHPPQPFMRPAWDAEGMATLDRLATELWADIQRTAARQARRAARQAARAG
jgi:HK97 gp10 family phage protein